MPESLTEKHTDDQLAYVVGRIIMAYGKLDQTIWSGVSILRNIERGREREGLGQPYPDAGPPDKRFERRMKLMRRLLVALSNDSEVGSLFDKAKLKQTGAARIRHHVAHGRLQERNGRYHVGDHREIFEYSKANDSLSKKLWGANLPRPEIEKRFAAIWHRHHLLSYSLEEISNAADALEKCAGELSALVTLISQDGPKTGKLIEN